MQKGDANDSLSIEDEVEEIVRIAAPLAPAIHVFMVRYPLIFPWRSQLYFARSQSEQMALKLPSNQKAQAIPVQSIVGVRASRGGYIFRHTSQMRLPPVG
jgi:hypothetical protein